MKSALAGLLLVLLASPLVAQLPGTTQPSVLVAPVGDVHLRPGASVKVELDFRVSPNFHINSSKPNSNLLIPTTLTLVTPKPLEIAAIQYPAGEEQSFPFAPDEKLSVYTGDFAIMAVLKIPSNATASSFHVGGNLYYQACDKNACYPPKRVPVDFNVTVK